MPIDITKVDLKELIRHAYDLSNPQGMGFMHYRPGPIPEELVEDILKDTSSYCALSMDYVMGRAVKLSVHKDGDKLSLPDKWFDHDNGTYQILLDRLGINHKVE